jgi:hypothetical protein
MTTDWEAHLGYWRDQYKIRARTGVDVVRLVEVEAALGPLPRCLYQLYRTTNGLAAGTFCVLPIFDANAAKATWDSIERANTSGVTRFLGGDAELLSMFLVFADIGGERCAAFGRADNRIWYESNGEMTQTNIELAEFVDASLRALT